MEEKKYGYSVLRALMGNCKGVARADLLGVSNNDRESVDYFLQFIERRDDGLYLNSRDTEGLNRDEFAAVTGDFEFTRDIGAPLLPIPFTVEQLRGVEAALDIVGRLAAGVDTDALLMRLQKNNTDAAVVARELIRLSEVGSSVVSGPVLEGATPPSGSAGVPSTAGHDCRGERIKRSVLILRYRDRWPQVERDMKDGSRNGLSKEARDVGGYWWAGSAEQWARNAGRIQDFRSPAGAVTLHRLMG